ncbi:hypothetical protein BJ742DRAFT_186561 [Cladochytrium replicatum]|nr:hypothetical protein BJ742DRAFT_186561 [Cladochytrium replicatum]
MDSAYQIAVAAEPNGESHFYPCDHLSPSRVLKRSLSLQDTFVKPKTPPEFQSEVLRQSLYRVFVSWSSTTSMDMDRRINAYRHRIETDAEVIRFMEMEHQTTLEIYEARIRALSDELELSEIEKNSLEDLVGDLEDENFNLREEVSALTGKPRCETPHQPRTPRTINRIRSTPAFRIHSRTFGATTPVVHRKILATPQFAQPLDRANIISAARTVAESERGRSLLRFASDVGDVQLRKNDRDCKDSISGCSTLTALGAEGIRSDHRSIATVEGLDNQMSQSGLPTTVVRKCTEDCRQNALCDEDPFSVRQAERKDSAIAIPDDSSQLTAAS